MEQTRQTTEAANTVAESPHRGTETQDADHLRCRAPPHHLGGTKPAMSTMEGTATAPATATVAPPPHHPESPSPPPGSGLHPTTKRSPSSTQPQIWLWRRRIWRVHLPPPRRTARAGEPRRRGGRPHRRLPRGRAGSRLPARVAARWDVAGCGWRRLGFSGGRRRPRGG
jgi:hypothetical protein